MYRHLSKLKNKKTLIAVLACLGIILTTVGVTVAWFTYSKDGQKENTIRSGNVTFHYQEESRIIDIDDMMPMTDDQGKRQTDYFDFTITSNTSRTLDIPYYITVRRTEDSESNMDNIVKVYLTKVTGEGQNEQETQVALSKFSNLNHYTNSAINIPLSEKSLYNDTVLAGTTGYTQKYRLRMWIDYDANYIVQTDGEEDSYPLQDKSYALMVNVYGEGNDIGASEANFRNSTAITKLTVGGTELTSTDSVNYTAEYYVTDGTVTKTIEIETENPNATVTVENLTSTAAIVEDSGIRRMSTNVSSPLEIKIGTNTFRITVTSANKSDTKIYTLIITGVTPPVANNFSTDSWETIVYAARQLSTDSHALDAYAPVAGGRNAQPTKTINMGALGTHTIRVANITPCTTETSETACGLVIEFADIISTQPMNTTDTNTGGYPGTNVMYDYVNSTVYNAIPSDIKQYIIPTTVVSSHYSDDTGTGTGRDANSNFVTEEYLYLLDTKEIYNDKTEYSNSAGSTTRQLDYYSINTDRQKCLGTDCYVSWWMRSVHPSYAYNFLMVFSTGSSDNGKANSAGAHTNYGVSPAFRIG